MGGQSFKCPLCDKWVLTTQALKGHVKDKHGMPKAQIKFDGPFVRAIEFEYKGVRCTETYR